MRAAGLAVAVLMLAAPDAVAKRPPVAVTGGATEVGATSATLTGTVSSHHSEVTYFFEYGTGGSQARTVPAVLGATPDPVAVSAPVGGLVPGAEYRVRLVASTARHTRLGQDVQFRTAAAAPVPPAPVAPALTPLSPAAPAQAVLGAPPPILGRRVNITVRSGTVRVRGPAETKFVPLESFASVPVGSLVDTRQGSVTLTSARPRGGVQRGIFHGGLFEIRGQRVRTGMTELALRGRRPECRRRTATTSARRRRLRALWGRVRRGNFRTRGGDSVATVRGTVWYVEDRCEGTLTRVRRGSVYVRDLRLRRTVVVRAGERYLARARR